MSRFLVSSRTPFGVEDELAEDGVGDLALERPQSLPLGLAFSNLALEIDPTICSRIADLGECGDVDGVVEFPVASTREPVSDPTSRRVLYGSHTRVGSEVVPGGEAPNVARVTNHHAGNDRAHAIDLGQ